MSPHSCKLIAFNHVSFSLALPGYVVSHHQQQSNGHDCVLEKVSDAPLPTGQAGPGTLLPLQTGTSLVKMDPVPCCLYKLVKTKDGPGTLLPCMHALSNYRYYCTLGQGTATTQEIP